MLTSDSIEDNITLGLKEFKKEHFEEVCFMAIFDFVIFIKFFPFIFF